MGIEGEWKLALNANLSVMRSLSDQIKAVEKVVLSQVKPEPGFASLRCVVGVGEILAMTIWLETGDIGRFKQVGNYASSYRRPYCRCVGSQKLSNGQKKGQGNCKNGNKYLARAFVEAANFDPNCSLALNRFYLSGGLRRQVRVQSG